MRKIVLWVLAGFLLASPAQAQQDKEETQLSDVKVKQAEKPTLEGESEGPMKTSIVGDKKVESVKKTDEAIQQLKDLLKATPRDNPQRAEFLFNLAEMYWDKSRFYEQGSYARQSECFSYRDQGDAKKEAQCEQGRKDMLNESKRWKEESVQLYVEIIRNFPTFKDLDEVYFYLGANLMEVGKKKEAIEFFKRLINDFPKSQHIPNVLLAFGDYYFDNDDMDQALKAYQRVGQYPKSTAYPYARYKEAWCHFNLDSKPKALDTFLDVLKLSKSAKSGVGAGLVRQTRNDIVLTYSHIGAADKAIPFFRRVASDKEDWVPMGERLAILYSDKGKPSDSTQVYRELISVNKESVKTIDYQYEIVRNTTTINSYSPDSVKEIVRLMKLVQLADSGKGFKDVDPKTYPQTRARSEELVRTWAITYHREAQKTKNPDLYAMAYFLYKEYLDTFDNQEEEYNMQFFYGELLYRLQKWEEAATAYEKVLAMDEKGKYTNESVHALVLSYFKIVNTSEEQANLQARKDEMLEEPKEGEEDKPAPIPEAKPIPDLHQRLIAACEKYVALNPEGDRIVDVKYTMGRTYYDFDHHDKAIVSFKDIAHNHSEHRLAVIAANLHLDSLNLLRKYDDLHIAVIEYLEKQPIKDEAFLSDINALNASIRFKKCTVLDDEEKWKDAAQCFVDFYRDFPQSELVDKALYNAALDFERMKELGKAIQVRIFLLKERPDSELAPKSLYNIGGNYHALAVYTEAAKFYELYAATYPKMENAEVALANASTFRQGLGELDKAVENYETFLELYGKRDEDKSAEVYYQIATIYEQQGRKKDAFNQYQGYLKRFGKKGPANRYLESHMKIGMYYWELGGSSNRKTAKTWFNKTLKEFNSMSKADQEAMTTGRDAAAQARFMLGEEVFEEMVKIKIDSPNEKVLKKRMQEKMKVAMEAKEIFESVILFGRPDWAIAGLYRIGAGFQDLANNIRQSPPPPRLTYDQKEIYRGILEDNASQIETLAVDAYKRALDIAKEKSWFNQYSRRAEVALAQLRPREFRRPSELRAQPDHFSSGLSRVPFLKQVKDEDRLTDFGSSEPPMTEPTSQR